MALPGLGVGNRAVASGLLAGEAQGLAIDFTHPNRNWQMHVLDTGTPANSLIGNPYNSLTYTSPSLKLCRQSDGVWRYGNHNLALQSQTFDNASWGKTACSVSANSTTAPDGTSTADTLVEDNTNAQHYLSQGSMPGGRAAQFSVYVKAKERSWIIVESDNGLTYFDVGNGALGTNNAGGTITSVGSGWYLCKISQTDISNNVYIRMATANNVGSYAGDGTSGIYIWGAQVKRTPVSESTATTPTGYLATTAAAKYDLPYEWDASGNAQGILIEEQRTNLCLRSQDFATSWGVNVVTVTSNSTTAPDGTTTADTADVTGNFAYLRMANITVSASTAYVFSFFAKRGTATRVDYSVYDNSNAADIVSSTNYYSSINSSTWTRVEVAFTTPVGCVDINVYPIRNNGNFTGTTFFWGAQLEAGSFPTSPIHTIGATVTRAADNISLATSAFPAMNSAGTMVMEASEMQTTSGAFPFGVRLEEGSNVSRTMFYGNGGSGWQFQVRAASSTTADLSTGVAQNTSTHKLAGAWASNDAAACGDGGSVTTDATVGVGSTYDTLHLGHSTPINGHMRKVTLLPRRVTNGELQTRTT